MIERTIANLKRGAEFVRNNPQLLYTIFLLIVVPLAFIVSGGRFLDVAQKNQERIEQTYVSSLHDALIDTARDAFADPGVLQIQVDRLAERDPDIAHLAILKKEGESMQVLASSNYDELGTVMPIGTTPNEPGNEYRIAQSNPGGTFVFPGVNDDGRILHGVRAVAADDGTILGFLVTDISMSRIDTLAARGVREAYTFSIFFILAIFILLIRHARIIDYTVLYRKLAEVDKLKDDFISMAAHELRTPISVVRGYASMLVEGGKLPAEEAKQADYITRSAAQLNSLVDDLLDVMRIEQNRMEFALVPTDVGAVVREVTDMLAVNAKEKNLALNMEIAADVRAALDPDRFRQVMLNIAGNAVKYTPQGNVTVRVAAEGGKAVVRVSDTGIGISAEDQKNLFSKFYRVKSEETKAIRGTGLGLWITRQMIEKMRGTIGLESIKGRGTDVTLSFPLVKLDKSVK